MSVNTHNTYTTGIQAFEQFRKSQGLPSSWPPLDVHLNMFIAHLSLQGFKHATAKSYISAISYKIISCSKIVARDEEIKSMH